MPRFDPELRLGGARSQARWHVLVLASVVLASWLALGLALGGAQGRIEALEAEVARLHAREAGLRDRIRVAGDLATTEAEVAAARARLDTLRAEQAAAERGLLELRAAAQRASPPPTPAGEPPASDAAAIVATPSPPDAIAEAQRALTRLGFGPLAPDGVLGPNTRRVLERFQRERGLAVTGDLDGPTVAALAPAALAGTQ